MTINAYEELIDVIATGPAAERIVRFGASEENQRRVADLLNREKRGTLLPQETADLNHYLQFEHLVRMAKARAHLYLQQSAGANG